MSGDTFAKETLRVRETCMRLRHHREILGCNSEVLDQRATAETEYSQPTRLLEDRITDNRNDATKRIVPRRDRRKGFARTT